MTAPGGLIRAAALIVGALLSLASVLAILGAGPWYDEFFTLAATDAPGGFLVLLRQHWLTDNHPPLFYALAWASQGLGDGVEPRRFLNLALLAMTVCGLVRMARWRKDGPALLSLYAVILASATPTLDKVAELRSSYLSLTGATLAIAALSLLARPGALPGRRSLIALSAALLLAFNVHFVTTVIVGAIAGACALRLVLARDWPGLRQLLTACVVALVPLILTTAIQASIIAANTRTFWIAGGFAAARWQIERVAVDAMVLNLPATLAGLAGLAMLLAASRKLRRMDEDLATALTIALGILLGLTTLLAIHAWRPIIITRYLIALYPAVAMILALGANALVARASRSAGLAVAALAPLAALLAIAQNLDRALHRISWYGTGRAIAAVVRACPSALVRADRSWNAPLMATPPHDNRIAMRIAYPMVAQHLGFAIEPAAARRMSAPCPTVFWTEHVADLAPDAAMIAENLRAQGFPVGEVRLHRIGRGWIALAARRD